MAPWVGATLLPDLVPGFTFQAIGPAHGAARMCLEHQAYVSAFSERLPPGPQKEFFLPRILFPDLGLMGHLLLLKQIGSLS